MIGHMMENQEIMEQFQQSIGNQTEALVAWEWCK
jgi:hypothetical protein